MPTGNTATGTPKRTAAATDDHEPEPHAGKSPPPNGDDGSADTNATSDPPPVASDRTSANDRAAKRPRRGTEAEPPAHHDTAAPAVAAAATSATAEAEPAAPTPPGPNAQKTDRRGAAPTDKTVESARRSAPAAQPTATPLPPARQARTTPATNGAADEGNEREPQKPTTVKGIMSTSKQRSPLYRNRHRNGKDTTRTPTHHDPRANRRKSDSPGCCKCRRRCQ